MMSHIRTVAVFIAATLIVALAPAAAIASESSSAVDTSEVVYGSCTELATGTVVALSELQERVPDSVPVLSLTEQGAVFPGSDDLGVLIVRTLECDSISVTIDGKTRTQYDRHTAHVGTAIDTSGLPASPFSYDGGNAADFNNYIFAYYSDSSIYLDAMRRAGVQPIASAQIDIDDVTVEECVLDRTVTVRPNTRTHDYGFTATGIVPDAACEAPVVPFIGNWWSVTNGEASVLSNNITGQSAIFLDTAETIVTLVPTSRSQLADVFGADSATADAFGFVGSIPGSDLIIANVGAL